MTTQWLTARAFHADDSVREWRIVEDGASAFYRTTTLAQSAGLVTAIAELPAAVHHQPDADIRPDGVTVRTATRGTDGYGISSADLEVARAVSTVAREQELTADPSRLQSLLIIPGAPSIKEIMPFWQAVLGYDPRPDSPDEDLVDPRRRGASFWFETMKQPRGDGGGAIHVAVWVAPQEAKARVDAALAAGGRMVRDTDAPAAWTLADAYGNEADVATVEGRD